MLDNEDDVPPQPPLLRFVGPDRYLSGYYEKAMTNWALIIMRIQRRWMKDELNPNAIHLLEQNTNMIDWGMLSENPNAIIHLLE